MHLHASETGTAAEQDSTPGVLIVSLYSACYILMANMETGFKAIVVTVVSGLVLSAFFNGMAHLLPFWVNATFILAFAVGDVALVFSMPSWGLAFTLGWLGGALIFLDSGLLSGWAIVFWIVAPVVGLLARARNSFGL
jgi:hypothetical protein